MLPNDTPIQTEPLIESLRRLVRRWREASQRPNTGVQHLRIFVVAVRSQLRKIYGRDAAQLSAFPQEITIADSVHDEFTRRIEHVERMIAGLEAMPFATSTPLLGKRIFIGHGRSPLWRELKDFISDRLNLPWDEFNRQAVAGYTTSERLQGMLAEAAFAFLVMTAEEEHSDGSVHARVNVVHEVGLFQGHLGIHRAIVLLEEGCAEFSNINGLTQIHFPRGDCLGKV